MPGPQSKSIFYLPISIKKPAGLWVLVVTIVPAPRIVNFIFILDLVTNIQLIYTRILAFIDPKVNLPPLGLEPKRPAFMTSVGRLENKSKALPP